MAGGSYSTQSSGSGGGSYSSSFNAAESKSKSRAESGERLEPWQQQNVNWLLPELQKRLMTLDRGRQEPFEQTLASVGGPRHEFGPTLDFGPNTDFGTTPVNWFPEVTQGGVWSDDQVNQRVAGMRAKNDASAAGRERDLRAGMASRGFGTRSPLTAALAQNIQGQNFATNTEAENDIRWTAAEGNSAQRLRAELAGITRGQTMSEDDLRRRQLGMEDDLRRRQMKAADDLQRHQLSSEDDLRRRQLAVTERGNFRETYPEELSILLNALNFHLRPRQYSQSSHDASSASLGLSRSQSSNSSYGSGESSSLYY